MREIKFRAWNKNLAKWDYFTLANITTYLQTLELHLLEAHEFYLFTGLHDKNGKEIYEGDIVKCPAYPTESNPMGEPFFGIVIYKHGAFCYQYESLYCESLIGLYDGDEAYEEEVIGNIYENPELLK